MKHLIAAAFALLAACAATPGLPDRPQAMAFQLDPPRDPAYPARNRQLVIPSGPPLPGLGRPAEMNALFFLASGAGPKPTMLLLHGLPGNERNLDLAQAVRRAGWNVLTFTYRGAWGSEGLFSIGHSIEDAGAALAFLRSPGAASRFAVDPRRIVVAGHSMGGFAAAATAARDAQPPEGPPLAGLILIDAWNIAGDSAALRTGGAAARKLFIDGFDDIGRSLGPVGAADLADELARPGRSWDLRDLAPLLSRLPVLTVYATHGGAEDNKALAAAIAQAGKGSAAGKLTARELDSDHSFADHRIALAAEVVRWLGMLAPH
jgi:pimeloyl-ACP methyl ester carboxylesterase